MKKLIIAIIAIFTMTSVFAQIARYDANGNRVNAAGHKINQWNAECDPDYFNTTEYFKIKIDWNGAIVKDGKIEHGRKASNALLMMRTNNGIKTAKWLYNVNGELEEENAAFHSFVAVDLADGTKKGYFVVDYKLDTKNDGRGSGIPNATIRIVGELKLQWNESRKHWQSVSGSGYAVGWSEGGRIDKLVEDATWCSPSKALLPIRGMVNVVPAQYLTEAQKKSQAPKK